MDYRAVLRQLHAMLQPQTYLEIGVSNGSSLALSQSCNTIGIDPRPPARAEALLSKPGVVFYALTSDAFFAEQARDSVLKDAPIELAFIDGLHVFGQVVRDFINVEKWCSPGGTVIFHDVIPPGETAASRQRVPGAWSGDVWQIVSCLRDYRPDLKCLLVNAPPSGLLIVRNLDPSSDALAVSMDKILRSVPRDGEPYTVAVRDYLASVSALSPEEVLNRLSRPASLLSKDMQVSHDRAGAEPKVIDVGHRHQPAYGEGAREIVTRLEPAREPGSSPSIQPVEPHRPLDPSDFSFHGFEGFLERRRLLEGRIRRLGVRTHDRRLTVVENAIYLPAARSAGTDSTTQTSGLFDANGQPVAEAVDRRSSRTPIMVEPEREVDEEVIYLGWLFGHYGHFLLESLARTWALAEANPSLRVVFHHGRGFIGTSFPPKEELHQVLEAFGISPARILVLDVPTRLRRVIVPQPLYGLSRWVHQRAAEPFRAVAERILSEGEAGVSEQPLYFSRRFLPSAYRQVIGEDALEDVLQENGFVVAYPETMEFADQVRLWNRHSDIFAADGTAAHSALFALSRPRLHLLTGELPQLDYFLVSSAAETSATFIRCLGDKGRGTPHVEGRYFPQLLESESLLVYLEDRGFLGKRLRSRLMSRSFERYERYDEAWLYARLRQAIEAKQPDAELTRVDEQDARRLAMRSWTVTLALASYFVKRGRIGIDGLASRFISLVTAETDIDQLARYATDVERMARQIGKACSPETADRLDTVLNDRFGISRLIADPVDPEAANRSHFVPPPLLPADVPHPKSNYQSKVVETDYYSLGRGTSVEAQERIGWQPRTDVEPWPIPEPLDWSANPYNDRNWFTQFHGWRMMDPYLQAHQSTGNCEYLSRLVPWMTAWPEFRKAAPKQDQRTLASLGGMRATRLALLLDAYRSGALTLSGEEADILYELARDDAMWLATPGNIALMNHAYFQIFGVELLSRVLSDEPWAVQAREAVLGTFSKLVSVQFTEEGVHVENSPCYHRYALDQIKRAGAMETLASAEMKALFARAWAVLPWLVFPDGLYADIGDCTGEGEPLRDAGENIAWLGDKCYAVAPFWRSGYTIVRSLPEVPLERASMFLLVGTSMSHTHSHADKLSFELFEFGKCIIVDTGKYGYIRDPMRSYVESAVAHNTVGLATNPIRRVDVRLGGTKLYEPEIEDGAFVVGGAIEWSTKQYAFRHRRDITYRPGEFMLIQDTLFSDQPQQYASRLHFDRSLAVELDGRILTADVDGHRMRVELMDDDGQLTVHRGEEDPIMGWQSVGYLKMEPTTMVEAICPGQDRTITWLISFD